MRRASISSTAALRVPTLFVRRRRSRSTPTRVKTTLATLGSSRSIFSSSFRSRVSTRARISSRNYRRWCVLRFSACANMLSSIGVINNKYSLLLLISGKGTSTGLYAFHKLKRPTQPAAFLGVDRLLWRVMDARPHFAPLSQCGYTKRLPSSEKLVHLLGICSQRGGCNRSCRSPGRCSVERLGFCSGTA